MSDEEMADMRFASDSHLGRVTLRRLAVPLTIVATIAVAIGGYYAFAPHTQAASAPEYGARAGLIPQAGAASLAQANGTASSANTRSVTKGARSPHSAQPGNTQLHPAAQGPSAGNAALDNQSAGKLLTNFDGVGSRDSGVSNFGAEFEPPDQGLCVGNGFVVEPVNSAYSIYRTNGHRVAGPFNVNVLFHEGLTEFTSDPRCYYEPSTHTWYAIILFISTVDGLGVDFTDHARTDIAVNTSGDPTTPWTVYHLDATDDGTNGTPNHKGCPCFGDQPRLGIDQQNLYISTDEFSILGPAFNGTQIYAISKADLLNHASNLHFAQFDKLSIGGDIAFGVQPAITNSPADAEFMMGSLDLSFTTDNRLGVWALTDREKVSQGGVPKLSNMVIGSETYGVPLSAAQMGSSSYIDAGDDRMQQVQFINGHLWGALVTVLTPEGDSTTHAGAAWFEVAPQLNNNKISGATIAAQGYVASRGNDLLYPAIQANGQGSATIVMTLTGETIFPSAVYTMLQDDQLHFGGIHVAASGTGPYDPNATRWGDYSWAALDPSQGSFWLATEYIPPTASQTADGRRNWGTRVFQVSAGDR
jgi:hypothetical protein